MDINIIKTLVKKINFDPHYVEATFQFQLMMELASIYNKTLIFPERSIKYYGLSKLTKERIDIVLEIDGNVALELKMPMNGQVPEQMFKFVQDIKFLEELKSKKKFAKCYLITVTNNQNFWCGRETDGIYRYFRDNYKVNGKIQKPTWKSTEKIIHEVVGEYEIQWNILDNYFRYFVVEV